MKDETCGASVKSFIELKGKMYTYITEDEHECKKAKSINNIIVDDALKYEKYKNILFNATYMNHEMNRIQRKNHHSGTYTINKISFSCYNDKNYHILKMETMGHRIFINLLVNHTKMIFKMKKLKKLC